MLKVRSD